MKAPASILIVTVVALAGTAVALLLTSPPAAEAARDATRKTVAMQCVTGWRGSAVGQYGGVGFSVSCNNGRGVGHLNGTSGTAYAARVGVESASVALDCAFSGDAATAEHSCGPVVLTIE